MDGLVLMSNLNDIAKLELTVEQLSIEEKLTNFEYSSKDISKKALLPQLSAFVGITQKVTQPVHLLCGQPQTAQLLSWLGLDNQLISNCGKETLFGRFKHTASGKAHFFTGEIFESDNDYLIFSAHLLLQDLDCADLLIKTAVADVFDTQWLTKDYQQAEFKQLRHSKIKLDKTIIILGDYESIQQLLYVCPALVQISHERIHEADYAVEVNQTTLNALYTLLTDLSHKFDDIAFNALVWALARKCEDQKWMSIDLNYIEQIQQRVGQNINQQSIEQVVRELEGFNATARLFNYEQIKNNSIKVDFTGAVIGQINGLTVVETALAEFGEPSRITANIFVGEGDISDIERKSDLGGNIHAKAMMILSSFVSKVFARNEPLPISSNIVFEQSYHEVDGDSASLAELYALLSAIANVPIKQNIAVTGAMDQLGNVLAVGGVDLKIEGFYTLAKLKAPSEEHAVIIPKANIANLNLTSEIKTAVNNGTFKIYAIDHVTQAAELLTGKVAETDDHKGLFDLVRAELDKFSQEHEQTPSIWHKLTKIFNK